jgi:Zn-finger domain-containing protein
MTTKACNQQSKNDCQDAHPKKMTTTMKHAPCHKTKKKSTYKMTSKTNSNEKKTTKRRSWLNNLPSGFSIW